MDIKKVKKMISIRAIEKDLPLAQIAKESGVSRAGIYHVINSRNKTTGLRRLICTRLGFKPCELGWPDDCVSPRKKHKRRKKR